MNEGFLRAAVEVVTLARGASLAVPVQDIDQWQKADQSVVTAADLAVEQLLRAELTKRFPDHGLQGEEFPDERPEARYQWRMDPIDGTLSFSRGIPLWGTILGLFHDGQPLVGVIDHPGLGTTFHAARGVGAFCGDRRLALTDLADDDAVVADMLAVADRAQFVKVGRADVYDRVCAAHPRVRTYPDCFGHTLAASGAVAAIVDYGLRSWDLAASQVLIEEAGGRYEVVASHAMADGGTTYDVVCGRPRAVTWVLERLAHA